MKTTLFNYYLPEELIAQRPADRRDDARMMVLHRAGARVEHRCVRELSEYLQGPDVLALNNTKVIPARVFGHKRASGGKVEALLLEEERPGIWRVLLKASRRPKPGDALELCSGKLRAEFVEDGDRGEALLRLESGRPLCEILDEEGAPPLPPYVDRKKVTPEQVAFDKERYQTVYASEPGAVAAPTAGLHFTPELFERLEANGVGRAELTLHVGLGTFRPVVAEELSEHRMHAERYAVPAEAAASLRAARAAGGRIVAIGSTSVRTLESLPRLQAGEGRTDIFIHPPYRFRHVDAILTNFHLPRSTLLMMMSAFAGREILLRAYEEAVRERYRFFSYGDCMLIL